MGTHHTGIPPLQNARPENCLAWGWKLNGYMPAGQEGIVYWRITFPNSESIDVYLGVLGEGANTHSMYGDPEDAFDSLSHYIHFYDYEGYYSAGLWDVMYDGEWAYWNLPIGATMEMVIHDPPFSEYDDDWLALFETKPPVPCSTIVSYY